MEDLIKTIAPTLIEALTPLLMLALTAGGTMLMNALRSKFDNDAAHSLLDHVEKAANLAVRELDQTILPKIRESLADDGKIDPEEARRIQDLAMQRVKMIIGEAARKQLIKQNTDGGSDAIILTAVEAAVHTLKKS